jgi:hypothetical protein
LRGWFTHAYHLGVPSSKPPLEPRDDTQAHLYLHIAAKPHTLAELVAFADRLPADQVRGLAFALARSIESNYGHSRGKRACLRQLVIWGALITRLIFELEQIPQSGDFLL